MVHPPLQVVETAHPRHNVAHARLEGGEETEGGLRQEYDGTNGPCHSPVEDGVRRTAETCDTGVGRVRRLPTKRSLSKHIHVVAQVELHAYVQLRALLLLHAATLPLSNENIPAILCAETELFERENSSFYCLSASRCLLVRVKALTIMIIILIKN